MFTYVDSVAAPVGSESRGVLSGLPRKCCNEVLLFAGFDGIDDIKKGICYHKEIIYIRSSFVYLNLYKRSFKIKINHICNIPRVILPIVVPLQIGISNHTFSQTQYVLNNNKVIDICSLQHTR